MNSADAAAAVSAGSLLAWAAAGLIAAAQIARTDIVPQPWRWAPLWVLGGYALSWAVPQIVFVSLRPEEIQPFAGLLQLLSALAGLAGTLGLGILAIVLAVQQRPDSVEVYRSSGPAVEPRDQRPLGSS